MEANFYSQDLKKQIVKIQNSFSAICTEILIFSQQFADINSTIKQ